MSDVKWGRLVLISFFILVFALLAGLYGKDYDKSLLMEQDPVMRLTEMINFGSNTPFLSPAPAIPCYQQCQEPYTKVYGVSGS